MTGKGLDDKSRSVVVGQDGQLGSDEGAYKKGAGAMTLTDAVAWVFAHSASELNIDSVGIAGTMTAVALPAGATYRCGRATAITVNSGEVTAYYVGPQNG